MSANDRQVGGSHYKREGRVEHWDIVAQHDLDYFQGQITKYTMRWRNKGGIQDLEKALHTLEKYIEVEKIKAEHEGRALQYGVPDAYRDGGKDAGISPVAGQADPSRGVFKDQRINPAKR